MGRRRDRKAKGVLGGGGRRVKLDLWGSEPAEDAHAEANQSAGEEQIPGKASQKGDGDQAASGFPATSALTSSSAAAAAAADGPLPSVEGAWKLRFLPLLS
ncbi:unnamed protein product [Closterium sp. NIES-53]